MSADEELEDIFVQYSIQIVSDKVVPEDNWNEMQQAIKKWSCGQRGHLPKSIRTPLTPDGKEWTGEVEIGPCKWCGKEAG